MAFGNVSKVSKKIKIADTKRSTFYWCTRLPNVRTRPAILMFIFSLSQIRKLHWRGQHIMDELAMNACVPYLGFNSRHGTNYESFRFTVQGTGEYMMNDDWHPLLYLQYSFEVGPASKFS